MAQASAIVRFFVYLSALRKQNKCDFHAIWFKIHLMPHSLLRCAFVLFVWWSSILSKVWIFLWSSGRFTPYVTQE